MTLHLGAPESATPVITNQNVNPLVFVGLDLSLTYTGGTVITGGTVATFAVRSEGKKDQPYEVTADRLIALTVQILGHIPDAENVHVAIEGPSFGSSGTSAHERAGLFWKVYTALHRRGHSVSIIPPNNVKKYACGTSYKIDKDMVLAAVVRRYLDVAVTNNNIADSLVLGAMIARHHGRPIETEELEDAHLAALDKIRWAG